MGHKRFGGVAVEKGDYVMRILDPKLRTSNPHVLQPPNSPIQAVPFLIALLLRGLRLCGRPALRAAPEAVPEPRSETSGPKATSVAPVPEP